MKTLILSLILFASFVQASPVEITTVVKDPKYPGTEFPIAFANENGVCKALGYERAVENSSLNDTTGPSILINSKGNISELVSSYRMKEIICINYVGNKKNDHLVKINAPKYPGTEYPITHNYNENAVCNLLGYEKAIPSSTVYSGTANAVMLKRKGRIDYFQANTSRIDSIICANERGKSPAYALEDVNFPTHPSSKLHLQVDSDVKGNGICKLLGYDFYVRGSIVSSGPGEKVLYINSHEKIEQMVSTSPINKMICGYKKAPSLNPTDHPTE